MKDDVLNYNFDTRDFESRDEQIEALSVFMNYLTVNEDDNRKEMGPENYHYAAESSSEIDYKNPSDKDYFDGLELISEERWETFFEKARSENVLTYHRGSGYHTYNGEITRWNEESYNVYTRGFAGTVNGVEVDDVFVALCDGLTKAQILEALRKSYLSTVEEYNEKDKLPDYLYGDSGDTDCVVLMITLGESNFIEYVKEFNMAMKRGVANKAGRTVIKDGKKFIVENDNKSLKVKKNPIIEAEVKDYLANVNQKKEAKDNSSYKVVIKDKMKKILYELSLFQFREGLKAPLSKSIDDLIQNFNNQMEEKAELIRIRKRI